MPGMESINTTASEQNENNSTTKWDNMTPSAEAQTETPAETGYENEFNIDPELAAEQEAAEQADFRQYTETMNSEQDVISGNDMAVTAETVTNVDPAAPEDNNDRNIFENEFGIDPEIAAQQETQEQVDFQQHIETSTAEEQNPEPISEEPISEQNPTPIEKTPAKAEQIKQDELKIINGQIRYFADEYNRVADEHTRTPNDTDEIIEEIDDNLKVYTEVRHRLKWDEDGKFAHQILLDMAEHYNNLAKEIDHIGLTDAADKLERLASLSSEISESYYDPTRNGEPETTPAPESTPAEKPSLQPNFSYNTNPATTPAANLNPNFNYSNEAPANPNQDLAYQDTLHNNVIE